MWYCDTYFAAIGDGGLSPEKMGSFLPVYRLPKPGWEALKPGEKICIYEYLLHWSVLLFEPSLSDSDHVFRLHSSPQLPFVFKCLPVSAARVWSLSLYLVRICLCYASLTERRYSANVYFGIIVLGSCEINSALAGRLFFQMFQMFPMFLFLVWWLFWQKKYWFGSSTGLSGEWVSKLQ